MKISITRKSLGGTAAGCFLLLSGTVSSSTVEPLNVPHQKPTNDPEKTDLPPIWRLPLQKKPLRPQQERHKRNVLEGETETNKISKQQIDSLYQGYGVHYIDLWVGTPQPQRQTVIVSTGNPRTAFPCAGCTECGELYHTDQYFQQNHSTTYQLSTADTCHYGHAVSSTHPCVMSVSYVEGSSWTGDEATDRTYAGGPHTQIQALNPVFSSHDQDDADPLRAQNFAFDHVFACMTHTSGLFKTQLADGIMGMDNSGESFWSQAFEANMIGKKAFALCLSRKMDAARSGTEAGALTMGGHDTRLHTTPMVYSKLDPDEFFEVSLRRIYLQAAGDTTPQALNVTDDTYDLYDRVAVDSGTTETYFPRGFAMAFQQLYQEMTGEPYSHASKTMTREQVETYPTIILQFEGYETLNQQSFDGQDPTNVPNLAASIDSLNPYDILVKIPPTHYFEEYPEGVFTARFYVDEAGFEATVGANTMMGHDILFDVEEGAIGFAESHCDYDEIEKEAAEEEEGGSNDQVTTAATTKAYVAPTTAVGGAPDDTSIKSKQEDPSSKKDPNMTSSSSGSSSILIAGVLAVCAVGGAAYVGVSRGWFRGDRLQFGSLGRHQRIPLEGSELELRDVNAEMI